MSRHTARPHRDDAQAQDLVAEIDVVRPQPDEIDTAGALVDRINQMLDAGQRDGRLVGPDGSEVLIPASAFAALRLAAAAISHGQAVTVAPHDLELTTQEAADLLHVSRPHLVKLLDRGDLPHHRTSDDPNAHRRVLLKDVLDYRQARRSTRRSLLRDLTQLSEDAAGGYS